MMRPSPVQTASHTAKIPVNIVKDASVAGQSLLASPGASALRSTTLTVPISRSTGLLGNPPVFSLLVTSCLTNQSRQLNGCWAISPGGEGNYYGDVLLFCRCFYLEGLTHLAHIFIRFETIWGVDPVLGPKPQQQCSANGEADNIA